MLYHARANTDKHDGQPTRPSEVSMRHPYLYSYNKDERGGAPGLERVPTPAHSCILALMFGAKSVGSILAGPCSFARLWCCLFCEVNRKCVS